MITVGQILQETRLYKKLTLQEVAEGTRIKLSFLTAIEKGEYDKLPSPSYAQGFVKNYAEFLGIPSRRIIPLFKREFDANNAYRILPKGFTKEHTVRTGRFRLRRMIFLVLGVLLIIFSYLFYQYRAAFLSPRISLSSPKDQESFGQDVRVTGETDPSVLVFVNEDQVTVSEQGEFSKVITLFPGNNTITVVARNTFGKETIIKREVVIKDN